MLEAALDRNPDYLQVKVALAGAYAQIGRDGDAERQSAEITQRFPTFSSAEFGSLLRKPDQRAKLTALLSRAKL